MEQIAVRDNQKCGFLKYITPLPKGSKVVNYPNKYWVIFCTYFETEPFLELYSDKENLKKCSHSFHLKKCIHIYPSIMIQNQANYFEFSITLEERTIVLVADTREIMNDWITCLRNKLKQLNILNVSDNYYTKEPNPVFRSKPSISFRPLPPLPSSNHSQIPTLNSTRENSLLSLSSVNHQLISRLQEIDINHAPSFYESIFDENNRLNNLERSDQLPSEEGPPPYDIPNLASCSSSSFSSTNHHSLQEDIVNLSLRQSQFLRLKKEIAHKDGVRLLIRRKDCNSSIAFVDWLGKVWVAGWKQKLYPQLHNTFHIGDYVINICGQRVFDSSQVYKLIEMQPLVIDIVVKRLPYGFPYLINRNYEGEDLGIIRESNTAEIIDLVVNGLAIKNGITRKAKSVDQTKSAECNWVITEINNRPLNLFFKNNEIKDRLNSVGKDISLLLQPYDLIKILKKKLKLFKNYKDYIVQ